MKTIIKLTGYFLLVFAFSCQTESDFMSGEDVQTETNVLQSKNGNKNKEYTLNLLDDSRLVFLGWVTGINNYDQIVGEGYWENGVYSLIEYGTFDYTEAGGINNNSEIVGFVFSFATGNYLPSYWASYTNEPFVLPINQYIKGYAYSINDDGDIVGFVRNVDNTITKPALWENHELILLPSGPPGGPSGNGVAYGINNKGQIAGFVRNPIDSYADPALWVNEELTILPIGAFIEGYANGINNKGEVVGIVIDGNTGKDKPAFWKKSGDFSVLPMDGASSGQAFQINNSSKIVGYLDFGNSDVRPVIWNDGQIIYLPIGDESRGEAWAINDLGKVVGVLGITDPFFQGVFWE